MGLVEQVFGKSFDALTEEERKLFNQAKRLASYRRHHHRNKLQNRVVQRSKKLDILAALGKPARCERCGYAHCLGALEFHHLDPTIKDDAAFSNRGLAWCIEEAKKCQLVCANCHRELHDGDDAHKQSKGRPPKALHPLVERYIQLSLDN